MTPLVKFRRACCESDRMRRGVGRWVRAMAIAASSAATVEVVMTVAETRGEAGDEPITAMAKAGL